MAEAQVPSVQRLAGDDEEMEQATPAAYDPSVGLPDGVERRAFAQSVRRVHMLLQMVDQARMTLDRPLEQHTLAVAAEALTRARNCALALAGRTRELEEEGVPLEEPNY